MKQTEVMSLSVKPEVHKHLKHYARKNYKGNKSHLASILFMDFAQMDPDVYESIQKTAEKRGVSVSELVEYLIERFPLENDQIKPIVLKVPVDIMEDKESLKNWLDLKVDALVNYLHP